MPSRWRLPPPTCDVKPEETRFLEMLRDSLELDQLTTAGIERGIRARNLVL